MAGNKNSYSDDEFVSDINVTPLVDVMLVLLVIFMIAAPAIYQSAIKVQLPKAASGENQKNSPLTFSVNKEGALFLGKESFTWETLEEKLSALNPTEGQTAIVSADQNTPHGTVVKLLDLLRKYGLTHFGLQVDNSN